MSHQHDHKKIKRIHLGPKSSYFQGSCYHQANLCPHSHQSSAQFYHHHLHPQKISNQAYLDPSDKHQIGYHSHAFNQPATQYVYQTLPVQPREFKTVAVPPIEYRTVPLTNKVEPTQSPVKIKQEALPQASPLRESIKGESSFEFVPFERSYIDHVPVKKVDYVPVEKRDVDYYALERQREYVPVSRMEKVQEYVPQEVIDYVPQTRVEYVPQYRTEMMPVERLEEVVDYEPFERSIIHVPRQEGQFYEEAEKSGRVLPEYSGFIREPIYVPPPPPVYYGENLHYSYPSERYMGSDFVEPGYAYEGEPERRNLEFEGKPILREDERFARNDFGVRYSPFFDSNLRKIENFDRFRAGAAYEGFRPEFGGFRNEYGSNEFRPRGEFDPIRPADNLDLMKNRLNYDDYRPELQKY